MSSIQGLGPTPAPQTTTPATVSNRPGSALQEATETSSVTKAEAAKGDNQAIQKLAKAKSDTDGDGDGSGGKSANPAVGANVNVLA